MPYTGLLAGLGNPGRKYENTRHNMGFMFIDALLKEAQARGQVLELNGKKFHCDLWHISLPQLKGKWLAAKPYTFMNDSGAAIKPLLAWHNLAARDLVVAQDELDIPPGALRFKFGGGLAGHNGLLSISQFLGTKDFYRLRIGVGKPYDRDDTINWVLGRPIPEQRQKIEDVMPFALQTFLLFSQFGLQRAQEYAHAAEKEVRKEEEAANLIKGDS